MPKHLRPRSAATNAATISIKCKGTTEDIGEFIAAINFANNQQDLPGPNTVALAINNLTL
jgi:hypothetical protein